MITITVGGKQVTIPFFVFQMLNLIYYFPGITTNKLLSQLSEATQPGDFYTALLRLEDNNVVFRHICEKRIQGFRYKENQYYLQENAKHWLSFYQGNLEKY